MSKEQPKIKVDISANLNKVWDYYTNPKHITKWNFADPSWHCPNAENDLRKGGKYHARMEAKDGSFGFDFEAIYDEVIDRERLEYTMSDGRKASFLIKFIDNQTEVKIRFDAEDENPVEMQIQGWQSILNNFKLYVESN